MLEELNRCKYCGGRAGFKENRERMGHGSTVLVFWIECRNCGIQTGKVDDYMKSLKEIKAELLKVWNR